MIFRVCNFFFNLSKVTCRSMHLDTIEAQTASLQAVAGLGPRVRRSRWMRAGENIRSNLHLKMLLLVMKS